MITANLIQETEARFAQRQPIRLEHESKIRAGAILEADAPERVKARMQHLARQVIETEGVGVGAPGPAATTVAVLERIIEKNDLMSVRYLELGLRAARTVGRVHVRTPEGGAFGTGFLVSPRLLMTNNHVLENSGIAGASQVEFNFQEGPDGKLLSSIFVKLDPAAFFVTDKALDFSLVALTGDLRSIARFGWNGLSSAEGKVIVGEYVSIIQHPSGERKQLAMRENQIVDVLDSFLHYRTDTSPGSSGSPVFNDQWEIVALHHSGVPKKDAQGRLLTKDGTVWTRSMGEHRIDWIANEGVRISRILKHVQGLSLSGGQAGLRKQMLDSDKGLTGGGSATEAIGAGDFETERSGSGWTLPLQLTIGVGESTGAMLSGTATPRIERGAMPPTDGANGHAEQAAPADQEFLVVPGPGEAGVAGAMAPTQPAGVRVETAMEWLTGQSGTAATMQEQLAGTGAD
jgi:endonuclease G